MEKTEFQILLAKKTKSIEESMEKFLPAEDGFAKIVLEAMNYSVRVGGKRLRPMLMWESFLLCGGSMEDRQLVEPFMAALEMVHTYSLVHDDLPAMDNDRLRRGKPTTWAVYGETFGILAGDALLNYAFETALKAFELPDGDADKKAKALSILAKKAGIYGMIGGQTADIEAENLGDKVTEEHLLFIHEHKTAALIQASMMIGSVLAGADEEQIALVEKAAYEIGVAFQIQDDILDVTSNLETLGKPVGSDEKNNKTTYVTLLGIDKAKEQVKEYTDRAINRLKEIDGENEFLFDIDDEKTASKVKL